MSALIAGLIAQFWPYIAVLIGAISTGFYLKRQGRLEERRAAELKDKTHALEIHDAAAEARAAADHRDRGDGLRADDGFRRRD